MENLTSCVNVFLYTENNFTKVFYENDSTAEDIIINLCRKLKIGPVYRHLFGLRFSKTSTWISSCHKFIDGKPNCDFELRIRFKVPSWRRLPSADFNAFNYYYCQVKFDVINSKVPDITYERHKRELSGLGVTDMYRDIIENGISRKDVESNYKKYISKEVLRNHFIFVKKPIHRSLTKLLETETKHDVEFIKFAYLEQFDELAPNYLAEEYVAQTDDGGTTKNVTIIVYPFSREHPGIRMCFEGKKEWQHLCLIDELCYISMRTDRTVEISRKNGVPTYFKFRSLLDVTSFVSLLDGYYRLMVKWTFNLCKDTITPSLQELHALKCHGPISGEFSYAKLEEKRNNKAGCYILRQSDTSYDTYYVDVCLPNSRKPSTYKIETLSSHEYTWAVDNNVYASLQELVASNRASSSPVPLIECVPPSEYDQSNLLLCRMDDKPADGGGDIWSGVAVRSPLCIDIRNLQVFQGRWKESRDKITAVLRGNWCVGKNKKEIVLKRLKAEHSEKLAEFLGLANKWVFLDSSCIVKCYGVTLSNPAALVLEHLPLGPLDEYLQDCANRSTIKEVDLVEAATYLATALWHLEEKGIVHGKIRCHKLLVASHTSQSFVIRLSDPGFPVPYNTHDLHWLPPECYQLVESARISKFADMWAFATTLWEIFSFGESPPPSTDSSSLKKFYMSGKRLSIPKNCPQCIYQLMLECWNFDPHYRREPQEALRDIHQLLYQVFNSRKTHSYATVFPKNIPVSNSSGGTYNDETNCSIMSEQTANTFLSYSELDDTDSSRDVSSAGWGESTWLLNYQQGQKANQLDFLSDSFFLNPSSNELGFGMQSIFELDGEYNVVLQGRIGQGFYGEVYKGLLEHVVKEVEPKIVAVKKLKPSAVPSILQDFDREIAIMKTLKHPNIVSIEGVIQEPEYCLIMEYVPYGSLQCYLKIHGDVLRNECESLFLKYALDISSGMEYLSSRKIVHRDLAARNILVVNQRTVKISDFGLAQFTGSSDYYILKTNRDLPIKWYAPESLSAGRFSQRSDVWSFGVTLFEIFSFGDDPRITEAELPQEELLEQQQVLLKNGTRLPCPECCPQEVYVDIISPCWRYESKDRPTFSDLVCSIEKICSQGIPTGNNLFNMFSKKNQSEGSKSQCRN
nr:PREDICTED: tyrosine-protein kinase hopscotch [Bemisia tabaci]